jgi:DNA-binding transcriptional regulator LsrR (DeoR family)
MSAVLGPVEHDPSQRRLDLAARAAWLYYFGNKTQDEIAQLLGVSRQGAQRLVALARSAGLIKFRLDHPIATCAALAERLQQAYGLSYCEVVPTAGLGPGDVAVAAAALVEARLLQREALVLALGSGRTLRAMVQQVSPIDRPQHLIVSLVGTLTRLGRASAYEVVMRLADLAGAECHPMPLPVVAESEEEAARMRAQRSYTMLHGIVRRAHTLLVGVSGVGPGTPLHKDGFIDDRELAELQALGAVAEICGWAIDAGGAVLSGGTNRRLTAIPLDDPGRVPRIGVASGAEKVAPLRAVLRGGWLSGMIVDEAVATELVG